MQPSHIQHGLFARRRQTIGPPILHTFFMALVVSALYWVSAQISMALRFPNSMLTPFWLPNTILLAAMLLSTKPYWLLWIGVIIPVHALIHIPLDTPELRQALQISHNSLFAAVAATIIQRMLGGPPNFQRQDHFGVFLAAIALSAAVSAAGIQAMYLIAGYSDDFWAGWRKIVLSNILPTLIILPTFLQAIAWVQARPHRLPSLLRIIEWILLVFSLLGTCLWVFSRPQDELGIISALIYAPIPILIWSATRFGPFLTNVHISLFALPALVFASLGYGPFQQIPHQEVFHIQIYLLTFTIPLMLLAALVSEHRAMHNELVGLNIELERRVMQRTSELEQVNRELTIARDVAEDASRAKSDFLASMSHELRTPLNAVIGMAGLLQQTPLSNAQRTFVGTITNGGRALLAVISDILDMSRIEAGRTTISNEPFDVRACLANTPDLLLYDVRRKNLHVACELLPNVPHYIFGDEDRLRQVLINLLANAVKFTDQGTILLRAEAHSDPLHSDRSTLIISIEDSGIGMSAEQIERIFQPFVQADDTTIKRYGGTGLGLSISKKLIDLMGGSINVVSTPGVGSCFTLRIPVQHAPDYHRLLGDNTLRFADRSLHILLVEDNELNQEVTRRQLELMGHQVVLVGDGLAAVAAVQHHSYDVILMDVQLPKLSGEAATRQIREMGALIKQPYIIVLTANALTSDRMRLVRAGADQYLTKPIQPETLYQALSQIASGTDVMPLHVAPVNDTAPLIDMNGFNNYLAMFGGRSPETSEVVSHLLDTVLHEQIEQFIQILMDGNTERISEAVHRLYGGCMQMGFVSLAQRCREFEKSHTLAEYRELVLELRTCFADTRRLCITLLD